MGVRILVGDALSMLRTLEPASVQCVVTSPPYFGLRAYGTNPQTWGGDPEHGHEWMPALRSPAQQGGWSAKQASNAGSWHHGSEHTFCPCGAWRGELGSEPNPALFIAHLVEVFEEVRRVLRPDGVCFVNLGDSYAGSGKGPTGHNGIGDQGERQGFTGAPSNSAPNTARLPKNADGYKTAFRTGAGYVGHQQPSVPGIPAKNLLLIPERFSIAMQDAGWIVRSRIAWCKTSAMPESVRDRPTSAWEHIWMFSKGQRYFYDGDAVRQPAKYGRRDTVGTWRGGAYQDQGEKPSNHAPVLKSNVVSGAHPETGANLRNYWTLGPEPSSLNHYAAFPTEIPKRCILARSRKGDTVLDPFLGSGTTALVADRLGRDAIGIELNETYANMARERIESDAGLMLAEPVRVEPPVQGDLFAEVAG